MSPHGEIQAAWTRSLVTCVTCSGDRLAALTSTLKMVHCTRPAARSQAKTTWKIQDRSSPAEPFHAKPGQPQSDSL